MLESVNVEGPEELVDISRIKQEARQPQPTQQPQQQITTQQAEEAGTVKVISVEGGEAGKPVTVRFALKRKPLDKNLALPITGVRIRIDGAEKDITWSVTWPRQDPSTGEFVGEYSFVPEKPGTYTIQVGLQYNIVDLNVGFDKPIYRSPWIWSEPVQIQVKEAQRGKEIAYEIQPVPGVARKVYEIVISMTPLRAERRPRKEKPKEELLKVVE